MEKSGGKSMEKYMTDLIESMREKLTKEIEGDKETTEIQTTFYNYLCNQTEESLVRGILKEDRTIKGAEKYCISQAFEQRQGNGAMVSHITVYKWVKEYFMLEELPENIRPVPAVVQQTNISKSTAPSVTKQTPKKQEQEEQIDLFEGMEF